jgi:hypothetical protein
MDVILDNGGKEAPHMIKGIKERVDVVNLFLVIPLLKKRSLKEKKIEKNLPRLLQVILIKIEKSHIHIQDQAILNLNQDQFLKKIKKI